MKAALPGIIIFLALITAVAITLYVTGIFDFLTHREATPVTVSSTPTASSSPPVSYTHFYILGPLPRKVSMVRDSTMAADPALATEYKQVKELILTHAAVVDDGIVKMDPSVASIAPKVKALRESGFSTFGEPPPSSAPPVLAPLEAAAWRNAQYAYFNAHPELATEDRKSKETVGIFSEKLYAAMIKADPTIDPGYSGLVTATASLPDVPAIDADALAGRMKKYQDIYKNVRDAALAVYAKNHANQPVDDDTKKLISLYAYLSIWDDYYGEGLVQKSRKLALRCVTESLRTSNNTASVDPVVAAFLDETTYYGRFYSSTDTNASQCLSDTLRMIDSDYPPIFKLHAAQIAFNNLLMFKNDPNTANLPTATRIPELIQRWGESYRAFIKEKPPHDLLYARAIDIACIPADESIQNLLVGETDRDFNEVDPDNPVKLAIDGNYYIGMAWTARGSGWANSVSDNGWKLFTERLDKADEILESSFEKYPQEGEMARLMLKVELGQGQGKDRMEKWFQAAIKVDPDDFDAYLDKEWYLQPRWYGSADEVVKFGQDCIATGNWQAKIPLVLAKSVSEIAQQSPEIYSQPEMWDQINRVYSDYLTHYPDSTYYRTAYAKHAFDGGHLDIAREQFKILGNNWDRATLTQSEYTTISSSLGNK